MKSMAVAISDANALNSMKLVPFLIFRMGAQLAAPVERASGD
jgi:hypothetical protein